MLLIWRLVHLLWKLISKVVLSRENSWLRITLIALSLAKQQLMVWTYFCTVFKSSLTLQKWYFILTHSSQDFFYFDVKHFFFPDIESKLRRIEDDPEGSGTSHLFSIIQGVSLQANRALKPLFERQVAEGLILDFLVAAIKDFKIFYSRLLWIL